MAISEGAFVWTHFPVSEAPREPGPRHIGYCVAATKRIAVIAYTSSQPWTRATLPLGVRTFNASEARRLNQRPFVLYLNRLATLPVTPRWFPTLGQAKSEIVATAPPDLRDELLAIVQNLLQRHRDVIQNLGPGE